MAGGDETNTKWSLDLDLADAMEGVEKFHGALDGLGEIESFGDLIKTATTLGATLGLVGTAVFSVKEAFDLVFEAEKIRAVDQQFTLLSQHAGIAGEELKRSMMEAAGGLMSEDDLLQAANRGIVELGQNATHMADLMSIARQSTLVMGGELKTNFQSIVQAIASGHTRALAQMGIIVDQNKAYKEYAASIGVATDELNKSGQQHAIMNAVLAQAKTSFAGVNGDLKEATNAWESFKSTIKDVGDIATLAFNKIAGPAVKAEVNGLAAMAKDAKRFFTDMFGNGAEQAAAHTERLNEKIIQVKATLIDLEQKKLGHVFDPNPGDTASRFQALTKQLNDYEKQLGVAAANNRKLASDTTKAEAAASAAITKTNTVNLEVRAKNQLKFQQQLDAMRAKNLADEKKTATSEEQIERINLQLKKQIMAQGADEQKKINLQEGLSAKQREDLKVQIAKQTQQKLKAIDLAEEADKTSALKNFEQVNKYTAAGFTSTWANAGRQASLDVMNFSKLADSAINTVSSSFTDAFKAMGNGSKSAGEAMKDAILGALGSIAISEGNMFILSGIGQLNPAKVAAGGALVVLGSALESAAGGGGSSAPSGGASGGGGGSAAGYAGSSPSDSSASSASPSSLQQAPQKSVSLTIHGNYYDSNESKMQLMDMIRASTDATDFNYTKVGGR